ncbi:MAG: hypothetical protein H6745_28285 [Deltaproteobacteria bacterium]|nr:hypothetical protein [Deltaproteobacteria bacterium]
MLRPTAVPLERALDAIYAVDLEPAAWLAGVLAALEPAVDQGHGLCGYFFALDDPPGELRTWGFAGRPHVADAFGRWVAAIPPSVLADSHRTVRFGRSSSLYPVLSGPEIASSAASTGFADSVGVNAIGPDGRGVSLAAMADALIPPLSTAADKLLSTWTRHLTRAVRLVLPAARPPAGGADVDALGAPELEPHLAREALREVALRATREGRADGGERAAAAWRDLGEQRLVLLDRFESGGRRYYVAARLGPAGRSLSHLSPREREVLGLAAEGLSNKAIAWQLGLTTSTVGSLMARAGAKVGTNSRLALIAAWRAERDGG